MTGGVCPNRALSVYEDRINVLPFDDQLTPDPGEFTDKCNLTLETKTPHYSQCVCRFHSVYVCD